MLAFLFCYLYCVMIDMIEDTWSIFYVLSVSEIFVIFEQINPKIIMGYLGPLLIIMLLIGKYYYDTIE